MCGQRSCLLRAPPRSTQGPFGMGLTCQDPSRLPTEPSPWIWLRSPAFEDIVGWGREGMVACRGEVLGAAQLQEKPKASTQKTVKTPQIS